MNESSIESVDFEPVRQQKRPSLGMLGELDPSLRQEIRQKGIDLIVAEFSFWECRLHREGKRLRHSLKNISQEQLEARLQDKLKCYNTMKAIWSQSLRVGCNALVTYATFRLPGLPFAKNIFELAATVFGQVGSQVESLNHSSLAFHDHRYQSITSLKQDHTSGIQADEQSWEAAHQVVDRVHQTQQRVFELLLSSTSG